MQPRGEELLIRPAERGEFAAVRAFYHKVTDDMQNEPYSPGWKKDIYPSPEEIRGALERRELYVGETDGGIAAAMVVNHDCNEGYAGVCWPTEAAPEQVTLIHALGVDRALAGRGIGRAMVRFVMALARQRDGKALRLDVLAGNLPAEKLYTSLGFRYVDSREMFYEDTGLTTYDLYEYAL